MKLKMLFSFLLIFNIIIAQKTEYQVIRKGDFPEGVYMTLEDVWDKKPSSTDEVYFETNEKYCKSPRTLDSIKPSFFVNV